MVITKMDQTETRTEPCRDLLVSPMVTTKVEQTVTRTELVETC